jgi:hypothetical protein
MDRETLYYDGACPLCSAEIKKLARFSDAEQSKDVEEKYYRPKPSEFFDVGGLSYYSCSS